LAAAPPPVQATGLRFFAGLRIVASSTLLSRVLGMFRDVATAGLFGLGPVMDAFAFAFRIPNLSRRLFGEGALSAAFLPAFARELERGARAAPTSAWQLATAIFALLALVLGLLVLAGELALCALAGIFLHDHQTLLLLELTAIMLPYALLICLAAQVSAVLHALGNFSWPAAVPVVLNVCWLASIWVVDPWFEPDRQAQARALAACVVAAGVLQLGMQLPALYALGYRFQAGWKTVRPAVAEVIRGILPVTLALSITQINSLLDSFIAWIFSAPVDGRLMPLHGSLRYPLTAGAVSALYFGERVYQLPLGVFGVAVGTVLFPQLARHAARGEIERLRGDLQMGLRLVILIGVPASLGLILVAQPLTEALFQHGDFGTEDAARTAGMIAAYGAGVWAYCAIPVLYRAFYALGDRREPLRIGLLTLALDTCLNLTLIWWLAERGLALSTALCAVFQLALLLAAIGRKVGRLNSRGLAHAAALALAASSFMGATWLAADYWQPDWHSIIAWRLAARVLKLMLPVLAAVGAYVGACRLLFKDGLRFLVDAGSDRQ
jgi:putative peptidoglycan lipid II flippase